LKIDKSFEKNNIRKNKIRLYYYLVTISSILFISIIISSVYSKSIHSEYKKKIAQLSEGLIKEKKRFLQNAVERTINMIETEIEKSHRLNASETLPPDKKKESAKREVKERIRDLRLIDNGYIWVNRIINYQGGDEYAVREIHPNLPETEGILLSTNTRDPMGNQPYAVELNGINRDGEVFFEYYFKKMDSPKIARKISYAKLFEPWDWVVATGVYLDDVDQLIRIETAEMKKTLKKQYLNSLSLVAFIIFIALISIIYFERQISQLIFSYEEEIKGYAERLKIKLNIINGIIDSIPASVAVINLNGEIEKTNQMWNKLGKDYGLSNSSFISKNFTN